MKLKIFGLSLFSIFLFSACKNKQSVAGKYKSQMGASSESSEDFTEDEDYEEEEYEEEIAGDAENGETLLQACTTCHNDSGSAKDRVLDASAVYSLDDAYYGDQSANHASFADIFEGEDRVDVEAALDARG